VIRATTTLAFQPSDVSAVSPGDASGAPAVLSSGVMALAGAHGPLPLPFSELLLERERRRDRAGLDFLDIFSQRMLGFLYRVRRKHRPALGAGGIETMPLAGVTDALSALGWAEGARGPHGERSWLRHAGLQGAAPRSLASLLALLSDRFGTPFRGRAFVGGWHPVGSAERAVLGGAGTRLGGDAILGRRVWDQHSAIELRAGPLSRGAFMDLLPGGQSHALLDWTARRHLQVDVDLHLSIGLHAAEAVPAVLGGAQATRLGLTSWLASSARIARNPDAMRVVRFRTRQLEMLEPVKGFRASGQGDRSGN
jgi:type VI secretion system protein ImpH